MHRSPLLSLFVAAVLSACSSAQTQAPTALPPLGGSSGDSTVAQTPSQNKPDAPRSPAPAAPPTPARQPDSAPSERPFVIAWCVTGPHASAVPTDDLNIDTSAVIVYEHEFGLYPRIWEGRAENGGVPQNANIDAHLDELRKDIQTAIPDPNFSGWAIIDYEGWGPVYDTAKEPYKEMSRRLARERHPDRSPADIERLARALFQSGARAFLERTINLCKQLRPRAKWGYYGMPWSHQGPEAKLDWLWNASDALYPTVYVMRPVADKPTKKNQISRDYHYYATWLVIDIARRVGGPDKPIIAMISPRYSDDRDNPKTPAMLSREDLRLSFELPLGYGADGVVFWDAILTPEVAAQYRPFITNILKPELDAFRRGVASGPRRRLPTPPAVRDSQEIAPGAPR